MAQKRDFEEIASPDPEQGSPAPSASDPAGPTIKKRKHNTKNKHRPNEGSIEWAKKRARTIERLLARNQDLPANVQNDLERELAAHKVTVGDKTFQKKRSAMISKYHMVRFFERKKAMRLAKQLRRKLQQGTTDEETEQLKKDLHTAEVDEVYTQYYPHAEPYVSLYTTPKSGETDNDEDDKTRLAKALLHAERPPMWSTVEKAMEAGPDALRNLRERRSPEGPQAQKKPERRPQKTRPTSSAPSRPAPKPAQKPQAQRSNQSQKGGAVAPKNRRERREQMRQGMQPAAGKVEDDSDGGGFFEED